MATLQGGVTADAIKQSVAQETEKDNNGNITKRTDTELKSFRLQSPSDITEYGSASSVSQQRKNGNAKFSLQKPVVKIDIIYSTNAKK